MKLIKLAVLLAIVSVFLSGCLYSHVTTPLDYDMNKTTLGQKAGKASAYSLLWLVAWGDQGAAAASRNGGITTLTHMDLEVVNIMFGLYTRSTTIVYGD